MSGLIIEGVCASGKTTILKGLSQRETYLNRQTKLQLGEHLTERIIENLNPTIEERIALLQDYVTIMETLHHHFYHSRFKASPSNAIRPCYLIERFHLTHAIEAQSFTPFSKIDEVLLSMNVKVVVLKMDEKAMEDRIKDTFGRRANTWYNYVMSFGGIQGAVERYSRMQERLIAYSKLSVLPVKCIDTTEMNWNQYIDDIEGFWSLG